MIGAVILAAGEASRFGAPKQHLMLADVLRAVRASSVDEIVVVAGAYPLETDARVVECPDWPRGMGASLRCGLAALGAGVEAAVVCLADGPELKAAAIDRVIDAWHASAGRRARRVVRRRARPSGAARPRGLADRPRRGSPVARARARRV